MATTAKLEHSARRGGGRLRLFEEESGQNLVVAGPRPDLREQGIVGVYGNGKPLAKLYATPADEGRLSLRAETGAGVVETVGIEAGSDEARGEPRTRPRLELTDAETGDRIVLGFDDNGPFVMLHRGYDHMKLALGEIRSAPVREVWRPQS